jgi:hypothetical protein
MQRKTAHPAGTSSATRCYSAMDKLSFKTVTVKTGDIGGHRDISTIDEALDFLRRHWPKKYENYRLRALISCLEAVIDPSCVAKAREKFIEMAKRVDLLISSDG